MFYCIGFQDSASPILEGIIDLHNYIMFYLILILIFVIYIYSHILIVFYYCFKNPFLYEHIELREYTEEIKNVTHNARLEIIWTITPSIILFIIAIPSFQLLYDIEFALDPSFTTKIIGHQWYWQYECDDKVLDIKLYLPELIVHKFLQRNDVTSLVKDIYSHVTSVPGPHRKRSRIPHNLFSLSEAKKTKKCHIIKWIPSKFKVKTWELSPSSYISTNSFMVAPENLNNGQPRLLWVDKPLNLPCNMYIRLLVTSTDVIHSYAIPGLGVKMDAIPGRLNQVMVLIKREGLFFGQCSELCGAGHGFMPIMVHAENHQRWLKSITRRRLGEYEAMKKNIHSCTW